MSSSQATVPSQAAPVTPPPRPHPLRDRNFQKFWAGAFISLFGDQFYLVALPWLVLYLTGSKLIDLMQR